MFADVWTKRDFIAAGMALVALALLALGQALHWRVLSIAAAAVMLVAVVLLVVWRVVGGPDRPDRPDRV